MQETPDRFPVWEDPLKKGKATHSSYSGLENSIDCIVHQVTKSPTRLSNFHFNCSIVLQIGWFRITETSCLIVLEARSLKSRCSRAMSLLNSRKPPALSLSASFLQFLDLWPYNADLHQVVPLCSRRHILWHFLLALFVLIRTPVIIWSGAHPTPEWSHLNSTYSICNTYFKIRSHSVTLKINSLINEYGHCGHNSTHNKPKEVFVICKG